VHNTQSTRRTQQDLALVERIHLMNPAPKVPVIYRLVDFTGKNTASAAALLLENTFVIASSETCVSVAEWLGRWTCDKQVAISNTGLPAVECNPGQIVSTRVPLSPSSII